MNNRRTPKGKDGRLADFADRLLAGEIEQEAVRRGSDPELAQMQETLQHLRKTFPPQQTDPEMRNRIRARVAAKWHKTSFPVRNAKQNFLPSNRTLNLGFAIGAVAIIVLLVTFLPQGQTGITGTAGTVKVWIPFAIFIIIIAGLIFWQLRKKQ